MRFRSSDRTRFNFDTKQQKPPKRPNSLQCKNKKQNSEQCSPILLKLPWKLARERLCSSRCLLRTAGSRCLLRTVGSYCLLRTVDTGISPVRILEGPWLMEAIPLVGPSLSEVVPCVEVTIIVPPVVVIVIPPVEVIASIISPVEVISTAIVCIVDIATSLSSEIVCTSPILKVATYATIRDDTIHN